MKAKHVSGKVVLAVVVGIVGVWVSPAPASDAGQAAADEVSQASYYDFMNTWLYTHTGNSRGKTGAQHDPARDNIRALFESYGLPTVYETFTYLEYTGENVIATKLGTTYPTQIYIIGGHYDSVNNPGADDNASGVALVLEAARILSQYDSAYTIRFIAFDMEEDGLIGSNDYVDRHLSDNIRGMIAADMVAYDPNTNHANVYGRTASNPIKTTLGTAIGLYGSGLTYTIGGDEPYSDHAPFEAEGFQACLLIEGEVWSNPYYHTQQDNFENPSNLNFPYAVKMTRSVVGWLVDQAQVDVVIYALGFAYPDGRPAYVNPIGGTRMRVVVSGLGAAVPQPGTGVLHYNTGGGWQTAPMEVVADNVYDAVFPAADCGDVVSYYVSAETAAAEEFSDPRSAPTPSYSATAGYGQTVAWANPLDTSPGWTIQGQWAFGHPTGQGGQYGGPDPNNGHTGTNVYGYNLSGDYANGIPEYHLTSTAINCTNMFDTHLKFWRWLGVEQPTYDHAYVRVSNNGTTWTTVWLNGAEIADTSWNQMDLDISTVADGQPNVYLRWTMGTTDSGWQYCGWNIDDIQLVSLNCTPPGDGDYNSDNRVDLYDFAQFQRCLGQPVPGGCEAGDMDGNQRTDLADYRLLETVLNGPQ